VQKSRSGARLGGPREKRPHMSGEPRSAPPWCMEPRCAQAEMPSAGMPHLIRASYARSVLLPLFTPMNQRRAAAHHHRNTASGLVVQQKDHRDNEPLWPRRRPHSCFE
jgi:hypothetical protein